jgi:hypothetical protein
MHNQNGSGKSAHILNTSATLFGLCFVVLTSLDVSNKSNHTLIDECTSVAMSLFMISCISSFLSIRSKQKAQWYENIADRAFLVGMFVFFATTLSIVLHII